MNKFTNIAKFYCKKHIFLSNFLNIIRLELELELAKPEKIRLELAKPQKVKLSETLLFSYKLN